MALCSLVVFEEPCVCFDFCIFQRALNASQLSDICKTGRMCVCVCVHVTLIFPQSSDVCQCFCRGSGNEKHLPGQSNFQVKLSPGKPAFW